MSNTTPVSDCSVSTKSTPHCSPRHSRLVGVTMRLLTQAKTGDVHDALSADWGRFLRAVGLRWLPLPNRGEETLAMAQELGVGGLIFTGGGDVGQEPARDGTEGLLLAWALGQNLPVMGVCRGFQALQWHLGGKLLPVQGHVATRHTLWKPEAVQSPFRQTMVNSFHNMGIGQLAAPLTALALSRDEAELWHVEAAKAKGLLGLMWHPEREIVPNMEDLILLRRFFA